MKPPKSTPSPSLTQQDLDDGDDDGDDSDVGDEAEVVNHLFWVAT